MLISVHTFIWYVVFAVGLIVSVMSAELTPSVLNGETMLGFNTRMPGIYCGIPK